MRPPHFLPVYFLTIYSAEHNARFSFLSIHRYSLHNALHLTLNMTPIKGQTSSTVSCLQRERGKKKERKIERTGEKRETSCIRRDGNTAITFGAHETISIISVESILLRPMDLLVP